MKQLMSVSCVVKKKRILHEYEQSDYRMDGMKLVAEHNSGNAHKTACSYGVPRVIKPHDYGAS